MDYFFFFQAKDGMRGFHVTGVQTCALPIFGRVAPGEPGDDRAADLPGDLADALEVAGGGDGEPGLRSEERRVGKEGRARSAKNKRKKKERTTKKHRIHNAQHSEAARARANV